MGVLHTMTDNTVMTRDVNAQLKKYFDKNVFKTSVPRNVSLEEAHSRHTHIFDYAPMSAGAKAYKALVKEILNRP
jgi:chromosome partitioning protein